MAEQFLKTLDAAELTNVGLVRERNEDTSKILIPTPDLDQVALGALFMVVDGMGGLGGGDVASRYAVAEIARHYYTDESEETDPKTRLQSALQSASDVVSEQAPRIGRPRIGATAAGIVIGPSGDLVVFNVGDCRVYRVRQGQIERVSHDQSVMEREIQAAGISPERAAQVTRSSLVTAFIGQPVPLKANMVEDKAQRGDVYVMCSDGVWSLVAAKEFLAAVQGHSPQAAAKQLINTVLKRGAPDNATVVVVRVGKSGGAGGFVRRLLVALIFAVILTVGGVAFSVYSNRNNPVAVVSTQAATSAAGSTATVVPETPLSPKFTQTSPPALIFTATVAATLDSTTVPTATAVPPTQTPAPTQTPPSTQTQVPTAAATDTEVAALPVSITDVPTTGPKPSAAVSSKPTVTLNPAILTYTPTPRRTRTPIPSATLVPTAALALTAYRITEPTEARACPNVTCKVVLTLKTDQTVNAAGTVAGSVVKGHDGTKWLKIPNGSTYVYVHMAFTAPATDTTATPESGVF